MYECNPKMYNITKKGRRSYRRNGGGRRSYRRNGGGRHSRGRMSRRMRMKGGLGDNDAVNIRLPPNIYEFDNEAHKRELEMFTFGSPAQHAAWLGLLTACRTMNIPFYILTRGDKIGIIRTLQLIGIDEMVTEVLCTRAESKSNDTNNPRNDVEHNFNGLAKYAVIQQILREKELTCGPEKIGYLMDDNKRDNGSREDISICPSIEFEHVLSNKQLPPDIIDLPALMATLDANPIYAINVSRLSLPKIESSNAKYNFTPIDTITRITQEVISGIVKILFVDFDQTFQIWEGAIPFGKPGAVRIFNSAGITINVI